MALRSTIYKAVLQIADMDRAYYAEHSLVIARHPSETDERMMTRLLAFALNAQDGLTFGRGLCIDDEPDLWCKDLTGAVQAWIEVGLPDEKWLRKACGRSKEVMLYAYGRTADSWWRNNGDRLARFDNLRVFRLEPAATVALAALAARSMQLQCNVQDGEVWMGSDAAIVRIVPEILHPVM
ncbi:YaeQ family protein [Pigmentiphaga sp.]|uniref:YaeQ family protein n=1 Tax=Pigmentiphaga sp. TaxID=1977564 RepID=UPI0025D0426F|nr:YaeQ family protein [Pigmentiphaga sp.]MBX6319940.1 YaeQ family protein [Pigmentiphaga sp.]